MNREQMETRCLKIKIKPCPFCGSKNVQLEPNNSAAAWVLCNFCESMGPTVRYPVAGSRRLTQKKAIILWNGAKR